MKMTCPHCGVVGSVQGSMPGEKVRCPQCDKVFKVMEQKIACPHCGVAGLTRDSLPGTKLRCPSCEKVFLLTQDLLSAPAGKVEPPGVQTHLPASDAWISTVSEAGIEPVTEELPEAELLQGLEIEIEPEPAVEPVAEVEQVVEVLPEAELELGPEPVVAPEVEVEPVVEMLPEAEPEEELGVAVIAALEAEQVPEVVPEAEPLLSAAEERTAADRKEEVTETEKSEPPAMPTDICAGCGSSFHPEFLQEVDSKMYCGVCQLRSAAMAGKEQLPKVGGGKLRGIVAALILLGLLALIALALMKSGIF